MREESIDRQQGARMRALRRRLSTIVLVLTIGFGTVAFVGLAALVIGLAGSTGGNR